MEELLKDVVGIVEATSFETMSLWQKYKDSWIQNNGGYLPTVGMIDGRPVVLSLFVNVVNGHKLLFIEATSQVVDWHMIEQWLTTNVPSAVRNDGYLNKVDAMNFHNVFPR